MNQLIRISHIGILAALLPIWLKIGTVSFEGNVWRLKQFSTKSVMGVSLVDFGGISAVSLFLANLKICGNVITCLEIILTKFSLNLLKCARGVALVYFMWLDGRTDRQTDRRTDGQTCLFWTFSQKYLTDFCDFFFKMENCARSMTWNHVDLNT